MLLGVFLKDLSTAQLVRPIAWTGFLGIALAAVAAYLFRRRLA